MLLNFALRRFLIVMLFLILGFSAPSTFADGNKLSQNFISGNTVAEHFSVPVNRFLSESDVVDASFQFIEDPSGELSIWEAMSSSDERWQFVKSGGGNFGFTHSAYWLRLDVQNSTFDASKTLVTINYPLLDFVDFYLVKDGDVIRKSEVGDLRSFNNRELYNANFAFRISQEPGSIDRVYIRVESQGTLVFPLQLWQEKNFFEQTTKASSFHLFYFGGMFLVVLFNLAIFVMLKERIYLYYSMANVGYVLFFVCMRGLLNQTLLPEFPEVSSQLMLTSLPMLSVFSLMFARLFLGTEKVTPRLDYLIRVMIALQLFNLIASFFLSYDLSIRLSAVLAGPFFILLFTAGPTVWYCGHRAGMFFTLAWSMLTLGSLLTLLRFMGIVPENFITHYSMQIGSGAEAVILMIALAYRIYNEREAKITAQLTSIEQEKQKRDSQEALVKAMLHDPVTKLPNRALFEMAFNEKISGNPKGDYMVVLARVDHYLDISRALGLSTGEALLAELASYYSNEVSQLEGIIELERTGERVHRLCNFSGDTFGVIVDRTVFNQNSSTYFKLVKGLRKTFEFRGLNIDLRLRFGAASYPEHGENAEQLIRNAIVSIESNHSGSISFYSKEQDTYNEGRLTLMSDLREDLKQGKPELFYQPKLASLSGEVVGMEALIRWNHDKLGFIPPDEFIPLAEETGLIKQLTRWVIRRSLSDYVEFCSGGYNGGISINISARNLSEPDLPKFLSHCLEEHNVNPAKVTIELTETAVMEDPESGIIALGKLTDIGVNLSIDDFGSGYSSLSYLKRLPATEIKLDRSLIMDILNSESDRVIVQTSIDMAHNLGYDLVAEGVETQEMQDLLTSMKCDKMQGYHLSKPLAVHDMKRWLVALHEAQNNPERD